MKNYWRVVVAFLAIVGCAREEVPQNLGVNDQIKPLEMNYVPGSLVVKFDQEMTTLAEANPDGLAQDLGFEYMERLFPYAGEFEERTRAEGLHRYYKVKVKDEMPVTKASADIMTVAGVEMATPQLPIKLRSFNDPYFSRQWHLVNSRYPEADINIQKVWEEFTVGNNNVIVSVVDEGVYMEHEDLMANLVPCYEDGSGSYNFNNNTPNVVPTQGHGTHVAGVISAVNNNGIGVASVAGGDYQKGTPGVKVLSCQIFDLYGNEPDIYQAIKHGADHGAVILQCSWGFSPDINGDGVTTDEEIAAYRSVVITDPVLEPYKKAIDYFIKYAGCDNKGNQLPDSPMKGGVVIFAAGNDNFDYDPLVSYDEIIAVGSFGITGVKSSFSNWGDWIDISAPGGDAKYGIYSTLTNNAYGGNDWMGTSFSCPQVSGVAALLVSHFGGQGFTAKDCKTRLLRGAKDNAFPGSKYIGRRLDAYGAFTYDMSAKPGQPVITVEGGDEQKVSYKEELKVAFTVADPINETYTVDYSPKGEAVSLSRDESGKSVLTFIGKRLTEGEHTFTISATNESGLVGTKELKITAQGDKAPVMEPQQPIFVSIDGGAKVVDLSGIITDPDGDPLTFKAENLSPTLFTVSLEGSALTITPVAEGLGSINIIASDGYLQADHTLEVVVGKIDGKAVLTDNRTNRYITFKVNVEKSTQVDVSIYSTSGSWVYGTIVETNVSTPVKLDLNQVAPGRYVLVAKYSGKAEKLPFVKY